MVEDKTFSPLAAFPIKNKPFSIRIAKFEHKNTVWPDGYIILKYVAIYNHEKLPKNIAFCQSKIKILPNTN